MKEFVSCAFLSSFTKIASRKGSIDFLRASHISAKVIIAFLARLDLKDYTSFNTSGMIVCKFCCIWG